MPHYSSPCSTSSTTAGKISLSEKMSQTLSKTDNHVPKDKWRTVARDTSGWSSNCEVERTTSEQNDDWTGRDPSNNSSSCFQGGAKFTPFKYIFNVSRPRLRVHVYVKTGQEMSRQVKTARQLKYVDSVSENRGSFPCSRESQNDGAIEKVYIYPLFSDHLHDRLDLAPRV